MKMSDLEALPYKIVVICRKSNWDDGFAAPHFTNGRQYEAKKTKAGGALYSLQDDHGNERFFFPNELCPHLPSSNRNQWAGQMGWFELIPPEPVKQEPITLPSVLSKPRSEDAAEAGGIMRTTRTFFSKVLDRGSRQE